MAGQHKPELTPAEKKARRAQARVRENQARRMERETYAMEKWTRMRQKGMMHYVLKQGLLLWTSLTSIIYVILLGVTLNFKFTSEVFAQIAIAVGFFAIGGILFGLATWYLSETKYKHYLLKKEQKRIDKKSKKTTKE